ncbi:hypothetical protein JMJ77_0011032 [Colletotrichum scovillei]|uniref:Uncharacterized protein n=1 Tax=Colletotrichum scovillei TaxID=1209932 RepID=A0A9P7R169_9PEZI|nr:hypothetical protein JMJ77_0011032 [Colletotrichum scovillei]KAG7059999.1 hypothetical protein JMJ78_0015282 [Colletotrichum scovillei]KAG7067453.1 hypothetical protein JMJ76_0008888 [Colletotrichum scovillei]
MSYRGNVVRNTDIRPPTATSVPSLISHQEEEKNRWRFKGLGRSRFPYYHRQSATSPAAAHR